MAKKESLWKPEDVKFLVENYKTLSRKEIADKLGRSVIAINKKLKTLNLVENNKYRKLDVGDIIERWTVLEVFEEERNGQNHTICLCKCSCGKTPPRKVPMTRLNQGKSKSCGCLAAELSSERETTHGLTKKYKPLIAILYLMHSRCYNENHIGYKNYGGRGIRICDEWNMYKNGDEAKKNFVEWSINNGYKKGLTIDRLENEIGIYGPNGCAWKTTKEQNNNKRNNVTLTAFDERKTISQWIDDERSVCKDHQVISDRLRLGWSDEDAIMTPIRESDFSNKSKYVGVSFIKQSGKWKSYITINKKRITIGHFDKEREAAEARDKYVLENNLKDYELNFPENEKAPEDKSPEA